MRPMRLRHYGRNEEGHVYYHCTDHHGGCDNTYIREERLSDLLGGVIQPIQITDDVAETIATALRATDEEAERRRGGALRQLDQRRRTVAAKLDRG